MEYFIFFASILFFIVTFLLPIGNKLLTFLLGDLFSVYYVVVVLGNLFSFLYLWQLKEYRFDRLKDYFKTYQGKRDLLNIHLLLKILVWLFLFIDGNVFIIFAKARYIHWVLWGGVFYSEMFYILGRVFRHQFRRPKFTLKALLITLESVSLQVCFLLFRFKVAQINRYADGVLQVFLEADILIAVWVAISVASLALPSLFFKREIIRKAIKKIKTYPDLKVIGITGSFGKTSTKEFLASILNSRFKILATHVHHNTAIGIARQILLELDGNDQFYIVEMGAYKKGEIKTICDVVKPEIGVITGLGTQHLSLFGKLENLVEAKFELIDSLPGNGLVILNADDKLCLKFSQLTRLKKILYSTKNYQTDLYASKIKVFKDKLNFQVTKGEEKQTFQARLLGKQNISNLLAATAIASNLGLTLKEISQEIDKIKSLPGTMNSVEGPNHSTLINDTYNSNPEGVLAALNYLKLFLGQRFLIFQPMIELGKATWIEHKRVFRKATKICDQIFLTNRNYFREILAGINQEERKKISLVGSPRYLRQKIFSLLKKDDVVLFEGREANKYLKVFQKAEGN
ncbi:MAG TPA: UDP-N-acetylmuramoyl-tripeptide--D-alanyl-D-alanine ligase [Candidatus Bathyarchaeia archaeon]|nr:UDP-N-acetylmuramoyl-tripeptide--D-alanyl-D-alanine ligase [Candidatus Bathyarchaeia archaeon]